MSTISHLLRCAFIILLSSYFGLSYVRGAGGGLRIKHRQIVNYRQTLIRDQNRVQSINAPPFRTQKDAASDDKVDVSIIGNALGSCLYTVNVAIGTPPQRYTLNLDTGSHITWIQCKSCQINGHCYKQSEPIFDPSSSSTYSNKSCSITSPYNISYADKSTSRGNYGCDTLSIPPDTYPSFTFGCGSDNNDKNNFNGAAGMLALGQNGVVAKTFARVFCYCLPPLNDKDGFIYFQNEAKQKCKPQNSIPLLPNPDDDYGHYYVNLVGITMGNTRLKISSYINSRPSTILDSGTIFTRLPQVVYNDLSTEFQKIMSRYPMSRYPKVPRVEILDTCYNISGLSNPRLRMPEIVLHFEPKNDILLDQYAVVTKIDESSVFCLAFAPNKNENDATIIGSHQQQKLNVLYDTPGRTIGFGKGSCGNEK